MVEAGRRERKKQATRAAVYRAALALSVRHGADNVTVEQIATEADIAPRTFFNYFATKEEAIMGATVIGGDALIAEFRARPPAESVLGALREAVLIAMDQVNAVARDHVEALRLVRDSPSLLPQQMAVLAGQEKALADAIGDRVDGVRPAVYPALCAAAAMAALRVALARWLDLAAARGGEPPLDALRAEIDEVMAELAAGLDRPGR
jgi:AcrR family transcriptional regulator